MVSPNLEERLGLMELQVLQAQGKRRLHGNLYGTRQYGARLGCFYGDWQSTRQQKIFAATAICQPQVLVEFVGWRTPIDIH